MKILYLQNEADAVTRLALCTTADKCLCDSDMTKLNWVVLKTWALYVWIMKAKWKMAYLCVHTYVQVHLQVNTRSNLVYTEYYIYIASFFSILHFVLSLFVIANKYFHIWDLLVLYSDYCTP